jgi:hypothetical protein
MTGTTPDVTFQVRDDDKVSEPYRLDPSDAKRANPLNEPLHVLAVTSCNHHELEPQMNGWGIYGPYRRQMTGQASPGR